MNNFEASSFRCFCGSLFCERYVALRCPDRRAGTLVMSCLPFFFSKPAGSRDRRDVSKLSSVPAVFPHPLFIVRDIKAENRTFFPCLFSPLKSCAEMGRPIPAKRISRQPESSEAGFMKRALQKDQSFCKRLGRSIFCHDSSCTLLSSRTLL